MIALVAMALAGERWTVPEPLVASLREVARRPLAERIEVASRAFLDVPYLVDAAGEMVPEDPDPPSRYDAFDCLTFVEEVLALATAADPLYAPLVRDAIRYDGPPSFTGRRHFMETEWIPGVLGAGIATDITGSLGRTHTLEHAMTAVSWRSWYGRGLLRLPEARLPVGSWRLDYLDLDEAAAAVPRVPAGALVLAIRPPTARTPTAVTHIGVVVGDGRIRHASKNGRGRVKDHALADFVRRQRAYYVRPVLGIAVLLPRDQGPRVAMVEPPAR